MSSGFSVKKVAKKCQLNCCDSNRANCVSLIAILFCIVMNPILWRNVIVSYLGTVRVYSIFIYVCFYLIMSKDLITVQILLGSPGKT